MITEKELSISNESYTKKDFYQIYPEILEIATKLSNRWDPSSSNESDPGVVLLKLLAFIGDKNNYNIDKNVLECFMPSATQETSMRHLCEMMGYEMGYFKSATTEVSITYRGNSSAISSGITFPAFETVFTSVDKNIQYILTKPIVIGQKNTAIANIAIEGTLQQCQAGDSSTIKLFNLDDNNRFYFPESQVAQNGVWIKNQGSTNWEEWEQKFNLNSQQPEKKCWKFGYDSSRRLPFVQFPDDIGVLIGDGLNIQYVRTSGVNGNIAPKTLTEISSGMPTIDNEDISVDDLIITNPSAATNGSNKETLNDAYNSFKRTIGTFDTLVTCRDYANAIYNMVEEADRTTPLVSNVQVGDIRNDLNGSLTVASYDEFGLNYSVSAIQNSGVDKLSHFDLMLYSFAPYTGGDTKKSYQRSFSPSYDNLEGIKVNLAENKTISHNIVIPEASDICAIKSYHKVKAKITTTYKVASFEEAEILNNIKAALYRAFNMRKVDFGEAIPFESILECIESADPRVKNVSLEEPEISFADVTRDGVETPWKVTEQAGGSTTVPDALITAVAKNVLAGRTPLFKYNESFTLGYGASGDNFEIYGRLAEPADSTKWINRITTSVEIKGEPTITNYTLKPNEMVQFIAPNLSTEITYPVYVNYFYDSPNPDAVIPANTEYQLDSGEIIYINYTDSNDDRIDIKYENDYGTFKISTSTNGGIPIEKEVDTIIVRPNFDLPKSVGSSTHRYTKEDGNGYYNWSSTPDIYIPAGYFSFGAHEQLDIRKFVEDSLPAVGSTTTETFNCYWKIGNNSKTIPWQAVADGSEYILEDGEYFFYSPASLSSLVVFGSGTLLHTNRTPADAAGIFNLPNDKEITLEDIEEYGLEALRDVFVSIPFNLTAGVNNTSLQIKEMKIVNLLEGDVINTLRTDADTTTLSNTFTVIPADYFGSVVLNGTHLLEDYRIPGVSWAVRAVLNLNLGPELIQKLYENQKVQLIHEADWNYDTNKPEDPPFVVTPIATITGSGKISSGTPVCLRANYLLQRVGGENLDVSITEYRDTTDIAGIRIDDLSVVQFEDQPISAGTSQTALPVDYAKDYYYRYDLSEGDLFLPFAVPSGFGLIMIWCSDTGNQIFCENDEVRLFDGNIDAQLADYDDQLELEAGMNIVQVSGTRTGLSIHGAGTIVFSNIRFVESVNTFFADDADTNAKVIDKILDLIPEDCFEHKFYSSLPINNATAIDADPLTDDGVINPAFWFDANNILHDFVISELDANSFSNIQLTKSSKL